MNFKILQVLRSLVEQPEHAAWGFRLDPRAPVLMSNGPAQTLPLWSLFGVYLLVERRQPAWDVPLEEFEGELLYAGMTTSNVHERLKAHFGLANMQSTYANHRWRTVPRVLPALQEQLARGEVVLYCVGVSSSVDLPQQQRNLMPEILEKHLLLQFALTQGRLPILNLQF